MNFQSIVKALDDACNRSQQWRQQSVEFASKLPLNLSQHLSAGDSIYYHELSDLHQRKYYPCLDEILTFTEGYWNFGLAFEIIKDRPRRISIKLRTDFRDGRLFVGMADDDSENFLMWPESDEQPYDLIYHRVLNHLKSSNTISADDDLIKIAY